MISTDEERPLPLTTSATNPFRGRRILWSRLHVWVLLWMTSLSIPTFQMWRSASAPNRWEYPSPSPQDFAVPVTLALATVVLGFAIGWKCRWGTYWAAVGLGAVVMAAGTDVAYNNGWSGGEALPEPGPFLFYGVVLGVLLGVGALVGAFAGGARIRRSDQGKWRLR